MPSRLLLANDAIHDAQAHSLDVGTVEELLRVIVVVLAADSHPGLDPVVLGWGALAGPGRRVELLVTVVLAAVPRICLVRSLFVAGVAHMHARPCKSQPANRVHEIIVHHSKYYLLF